RRDPHNPVGEADSTELADIVALIEQGGAVTVRGFYDVSGLRSDADLMVWLHGPDAESLQRALQDVPARFEKDLASTSGRLADEVPGAEEQAEAFARATSGQGPRSAAERLRLAEKLTTNAKLKKLAQLAGAFRHDARAARRRRRERATTEVFRVGRGGALGRILPSELAALRHPLRRRDLLRRVIEEELLQYDLRGDDHQGKGPVVVCIDGSGSMSGPRELWSKAVTLALLEIARKQGRRTRAIVFSGPEQPLTEFELTARGRVSLKRSANMDEIVRLAECFPGGGTDFEKPLRSALQAVQSAGMKGAYVVFITDGEAQINDAFAEEFRREKKRRDISVYAVLVDDPS
ncbi:MAG: chlorite dismutase family protein, partial [Myxococcales bacterium]